MVSGVTDTTSLGAHAHADAVAHIRAAIVVQERVLESCIDDVVRAADAIATALHAGGKLLICGNGGSAADSQHVAAELVCRLRAGVERPGLAAIALSTDTSILTAYANDHDFEGVFARQVEALGRRGDVLLAISSSGRSKNVLRALEQARGQGLSTVALAGGAGTAAADVCIAIPSDNTAAIQESMLPIEHVLCELIENALFPEQTASLRSP